MSIDKSGRDRPVGQVNYRCRGRSTDCLPDIGNDIVLDQDFCRPGERVA
ncbi:MAG: hypothetical protein WAV38_12550 [Xanthobacteraceae bacterium]